MVPRHAAALAVLSMLLLLCSPDLVSCNFSCPNSRADRISLCMEICMSANHHSSTPQISLHVHAGCLSQPVSRPLWQVQHP